VAQDFVQIGRLYAAGYQQKEIMEAYDVGPSAVRSSLDVLHRVMTWSLADETKQAIGLSDIELSENDRRIADIYNLCYDVPDLLRADRHMKVLFKSNPLIRNVFEKLSEGKRFEDIIAESDLKDFFSKQDTDVARRSFAKLFSPTQQFNEKFFSPPLSLFFQRLLFTQYASLSDSEVNKAMIEADEFIVDNASFLASASFDRAKYKNLFLARVFIRRTPVIEKILAKAYGEMHLPVFELSVPLERDTFFQAYKQHHTIPFVYRYIYTKIMEKWSPREIAADMRQKGIPYEQFTLEREIREFLNVSENILLTSPNKLNKMDSVARINLLARNRAKELASMCAHIRNTKYPPDGILVSVATKDEYLV
jgi:hypothetical protein